VIRVLSPGPLSTVQDQGRFGLSRFGISVSGAVDAHALTLGNMLVGNPANAAAIEVTFGGAEFQFATDALIGITGGDLAPALNQAPVEMNQTLAVIAGDRLTFGSVRSGLRAYVCVAGGIDVPPTLGSRSTYLAAGIGGLAGRALRAGDELPVGFNDRPLHAGRRASAALVPKYGSEITVHVIAGPQADQFTAKGVETFYLSAYTVTDKSDRQGVRLDGPAIEAVGGRYDIVSDAVVTGAIQVPGDARPIVLLADRQTTGGYPKIGVVATVDIPLLAQAAPGTSVRFARTTIEEAQEATRRAIAELAGAAVEEPVLHVTNLVIDGSPFRLEMAVPRQATSQLRMTVVADGRQRIVGASSA
jgi:antagonist of KipI